MAIGDLISSGNTDLDALLRFTAEIDKMTSVLRRTLLIDQSRRENDAEHSWHIAVMAMYFADYAAEKPDTARAAQMCLVHDLVEIYAGDTFAYDTQGYSDKAEREQAAADRLFAMLPEPHGGEIRALWEEFEACETVDSRYANCLDRVQPFLHNTLTEGHTWHNITPRTRRAQVEKRMAVVRDFMPEVYGWIAANLDNAEAKGWLLP